MLTIKLVEPANKNNPYGHEQIHEVTLVWTDSQTGTVHATDALTGDTINFGTYGYLYVMNSEGRTVAKYDLSMISQQKLKV